jgi:hypothetical protein
MPVVTCILYVNISLMLACFVFEIWGDGATRIRRRNAGCILLAPKTLRGAKVRCTTISGRDQNSQPPCWKKSADGCGCWVFLEYRWMKGWWYHADGDWYFIQKDPKGNRSTGYPNTVRSYLGDDATRQMWHRCNKYHELQSSHRLDMIRILNRWFCVMNICIYTHEQNTLDRL